MSDIVERLRQGIERSDEGDAEAAMYRAADEIERLQAENEQLKMGLRALIADETNGELAKARATRAALKGKS